MSCMGSTTLTIRIDEDLKAKFERAAEVEGRKLTDYLIRAATLRMSGQCPTCGRPESSGSTPAGLTPEMDGFLTLVRRRENLFISILITTQEGGRNCAYLGQLDPQAQKDEEHRGTVVLRLQEHPGEPPIVTLPIPRGVITGWDFDQNGQRHAELTRSGGYTDCSGLALARARSLR